MNSVRVGEYIIRYDNWEATLYNQEQEELFKLVNVKYLEELKIKIIKYGCKSGSRKRYSSIGERLEELCEEVLDFKGDKLILESNDLDGLWDDFIKYFVFVIKEEINKLDESILTEPNKIKQSKTFMYCPNYSTNLNLGEKLEEDIEEVNEVNVYNLPDNKNEEDTYCFECVSCKNKFNLNIKDLHYDEGTGLYSNDDVCPICEADFGYELIGKLKNK